MEAFLAATDLNNKTVTFKAEGNKYNNQEDAEKFLQSCIGAKYTVKDIQVSPAKYTCCAFYHIYPATGSQPETGLWCKQDHVAGAKII